MQLPFCLNKSLDLACKDDLDNDIVIYLDWFIESQEKGTCQLFFNENVIHKRSKEEDCILDLFNNAPVGL